MLPLFFWVGEVQSSVVKKKILAHHRVDISHVLSHWASVYVFFICVSSGSKLSTTTQANYCDIKSTSEE